MGLLGVPLQKPLRNTMADDILADVGEEGEVEDFQDLDKEKDTPKESPPKKEPKDEEGKDKPKESDDSDKEGDNTPKDESKDSEKELPFHEHPRWIKREEELNTLKEENEVNAKELAELKDKVSKKDETTGEIPSWFSELYGDNKTAWQKHQAHTKVEKEEWKKEVLAEQTQVRKQTDEEAQKWDKWVNDEVQNLKDEGKVFDRNKLLKVMTDYKPTSDDKGLDFQKGFKIYEMQEAEDPSKTNARKELADATTKTTKGEKKSDENKTFKDLRNTPWSKL